MSSPLRPGSTVEVLGLLSSATLNGKRGTLGKYDTDSARWEVRLEDVGSKKIKPDNLREVTPLHARRRRLCRYGERCYRPECWFEHSNDYQRCERNAALWQALLQGSQATQSSDVHELVALPKTDTVLESLKDSIALHEERIKCSMADIAALKTHVSMVDDAVTRYDDVAPPSESWPKCSFDERCGDIEGSIEELTDLIAVKHTELEARIESQSITLRNDLGDLARDATNALFDEKLEGGVRNLVQDSWKAAEKRFEDRFNGDVKELVLGTLQHAITPLAEFVTERILKLENRLAVATGVIDEG